ncbi:MAG: hypothetical protein AAF645_25470 [Myxococcota bacterium]
MKYPSRRHTNMFVIGTLALIILSCGDDATHGFGDAMMDMAQALRDTAAETRDTAADSLEDGGETLRDTGVADAQTCESCARRFESLGRRVARSGTPSDTIDVSSFDRLHVGVLSADCVDVVLQAQFGTDWVNVAGLFPRVANEVVAAVSVEPISDTYRIASNCEALTAVQGETINGTR